MHHFHIRGLDPQPFQHLFGLRDDALHAAGALRYRADSHPGFPDRIGLDDAAVGDTVLLVNHEHQPAATPYRSRHAVFVREGGHTPFDAHDTVPPMLRNRTLSLRAFDRSDLMVDADLVEGADAEALIQRLLGDPRVHYLHAHFARRGCFGCRIDRA